MLARCRVLLLVSVGLLSLAPHLLLADEEKAMCTRVFDGDTIEVSVAATIEKVRLIGVDTPETVDPRKPVEFFGKEASEFTRNFVEGKKVVLRDEIGHENRDKYGRLLRYVYLEDGTFVNAETIKQGYGHAYVVFPFSRMDEFRGYERQAREKGLGLWGSTEAKGEPGKARAPTEGQLVGSSQSSKYHRPDCVWAQKITPPTWSPSRAPRKHRARDMSRARSATRRPHPKAASQGRARRWLRRRGPRRGRATRSSTSPGPAASTTAQAAVI